MAAAPVYDLSNKLLGTVIVEMPYSSIDIILAQRDGLGDTGEIYIVGDDHFMRSKSRFISQNTILKLEINTDAVNDALRGNTDVKVVKDYRIIPVISAYTPLENLRDVTWILLVEIDGKEALYPVLVLKTKPDYHYGAVISVITAVYLYFTLKRRRSINNPLESLLRYRQMGYSRISTFHYRQVYHELYLFPSRFFISSVIYLRQH